MALTLQTNVITTTPHTISSSETVVLVKVAGPASIILPTGSGNDCGKSYYIKDASGNADKNPVTITALGGWLIDGLSFALLNGGHSHIQVVSDGSNWFTIA
jgi:hypothetical protein